MVPALVAATLAIALLALVAAGGDDGGAKRYRIVFDNAFGVVEGADFRVAGVAAGAVERFDLTDSDPPLALVEVSVDEPGLRSFRSDATCEIRPQSLIGEYYVNCDPGSSGEPLLNDTVPVGRTSGTIPLDLVNNILREPQRERLPLLLNALGAGLAGRADDVQEVLRRAHPGLRATNRTLRILGRQEKIIEAFVADSDTVVAALAERRDEVVRFVREAGETAEISASRRADISRSFDRLPVFLAELEPTMNRLRDVADAQVPVLGNLSVAAPELVETFERLGPFARASRPALESLGDLSVAGSGAIRESADEIAELRALAENAPGFSKPLRQFLQTLDDRERSIEHDPRAANSAPPAPDKTANAEGKGFTGMEALLNYAFWQTLAINPFDQVSHVLRFTIVENECSPYTVKIPDSMRHCVSWLGPYQPGVTAPDPTAGATPAAREERSPARARSGDPQVRGGEPEAVRPPRGQRDPSRPQLTLPDGIQELLERLPGGGRVPPVTGGNDERLLDFLLAP